MLLSLILSWIMLIYQLCSKPPNNTKVKSGSHKKTIGSKNINANSKIETYKIRKNEKEDKLNISKDKHMEIKNVIEKQKNEEEKIKIDKYIYKGKYNPKISEDEKPKIINNQTKIEELITTNKLKVV